MRLFFATVATLALAAGSVVAEPGGGKGKGGEGGGGGKGHAQQAHASPGGGGKDRGSSPQGGNGGANVERGGGPAKAQRTEARPRSEAERGGGNRAVRANNDDKRQARSGQDRGPQRVAGKPEGRGPDHGEVRGNRGNDRAVPNRGGGDQRRGDPRPIRVAEREGRFGSGDDGARGLIAGCPPGLAQKNNGCMPPGQLKDRGGWWSALDRPTWWGLGGLAAGSLAYADGYLLDVDDGRIEGWLPLLGGALAPGNVWPGTYAPVPVPDYYEDYYDLGSEYRYYDDVLYRVDPQTSAITSIAALLTGDQFAIGQPLPSGYDVYNLPYDYRDSYVDGPDAMYRYNDGYVYQVDPATQLVTAAIELLT